MGEFITWVIPEARAAGIDLVVLAGAETRGSGGRTVTVNGVVWHHTATGTNWTNDAVAALLKNGRPDLGGPLSQFGIERDGTAVLIAAGRCNHNGYGVWGNDSVGLEFYNKGDGEPFTVGQFATGIKLTALICKHAGLDPSAKVKAHRETDPARKIDPLARVVDMNSIRQRVAAAMSTALAPAPAPSTPAPTYTYSGEDDEMHKPAYIVKGSGPEVWITDYITKQHIKHMRHVDFLRYLGIAKWDDAKGAPAVIEDTALNSVRTVA